MKIGEIYFIKERDRIAGANSSYVKIGMVGDTERGSKERLSEHQTGNPRDLERAGESGSSICFRRQPAALKIFYIP